MAEPVNEHAHDWHLEIHLDGCHFYSSTYSCECGAVMLTEDERDPTEPYALIWFLPECERCLELEHGAKPLHTVDIQVRA